MSADKVSASTPNDHDDYRSLLENSQRGLDNAKAFIHAIQSSQAAASNSELRTNADTTQSLLDQTSAHLEQVWDEFQRIYKR